MCITSPMSSSCCRPLISCSWTMTLMSWLATTYSPLISSTSWTEGTPLINLSRHFGEELENRQITKRLSSTPKAWDSGPQLTTTFLDESFLTCTFTWWRRQSSVPTSSTMWPMSCLARPRKRFIILRSRCYSKAQSRTEWESAHTVLRMLSCQWNLLTNSSVFITMPKWPR